MDITEGFATLGNTFTDIGNGQTSTMAWPIEAGETCNEWDALNHAPELGIGVIETGFHWNSKGILYRVTSITIKGYGLNPFV